MAQAENLRERFAELIRDDYDYTRPQRGELREAVILSISDRDIIVDLGAKRDGIIPQMDLRMVPQEYLDNLGIGDRVPVVVMRVRADVDGVPVSLSRGMREGDWLRAEELLETGEPVQAEVTGYNRGGLLVQFGRLQGFVPNSHIGRLPSIRRTSSLPDTKPELVGETFSLTVIEVNRRRRRLVMSRRALERRLRQQMLDQLQPGEERTGTVCTLLDYGVFVDLGGIDGFIHISELDHRYVQNPNEVVNIGDEVRVRVLEVDKERQRIRLSRKAVLPDPWYEVTGSLRPGDVTEGTITHLASFGLFVDVGQGIEGLVHMDEIPYQLIDLNDETLPGTRVQVGILGIDDEKKQISLRLFEVVRDSDGESPAQESTPSASVAAEAEE